MSSPTLLQKASATYGHPCVSLVSVYELEVGARRQARQNEFRRLFNFIQVLPFDEKMILRAAFIQADLVKRNQVIGVLDVFIAATALEAKLPFLTLNKRHFERVNDLQLLDIIV
jgi:predicted nucleic acid-binding protein